MGTGSMSHVKVYVCVTFCMYVTVCMFGAFQIFSSYDTYRVKIFSVDRLL